MPSPRKYWLDELKLNLWEPMPPPTPEEVALKFKQDRAKAKEEKLKQKELKKQEKERLLKDPEYIAWKSYEQAVYKLIFEGDRALRKQGERARSGYWKALLKNRRLDEAFWKLKTREYRQIKKVLDIYKKIYKADRVAFNKKFRTKSSRKLWKSKSSEYKDYRDDADRRHWGYPGLSSMMLDCPGLIDYVIDENDLVNYL